LTEQRNPLFNRKPLISNLPPLASEKEEERKKKRRERNGERRRRRRDQMREVSDTIA